MKIDPSSELNKLQKEMFARLEKKKSNEKEIEISPEYIGWSGYNPNLIPEKKDPFIEKFRCLIKKNKSGLFSDGIIMPHNQDFLIKITRSRNIYDINIVGEIKNKYKYDVVAFIQRGGHGIEQGETFDVLVDKGYTGAIFSPHLGNFSTKADKYVGKYLDEVGFTTRLYKNKKGIIQATLPTDPKDERFLVSLMAMIQANWTFFLTCLKAKMVVIGTKAEAGVMASAIQKSVNPKMKIVLIAYTLYDNLKRVPKDMILSNMEYTRRLALAGMAKYGVPDGLVFMKEKIDSVKENNNATIVYMSFQDKKGILDKAFRDGVKNILVIPQVSPKIILGNQYYDKPAGGKRIHVMRLNSSVYLQAREILSIFFKLADKFPSDKFYLIAKEEHIPIILPQNPPSNFKYLGWIETDRSLARYIQTADTLWIHGGNRPSVTESIHASKKGVVPIFFTQDQLTVHAARFWKKRKFGYMKLLALMMAVEPMVERWEMLTTIVAEDKILSRLLVNPLKVDFDSLVETVNNLDIIKPKVQKALSRLKIATTELFAGIYISLLQDKSIPQIRQLYHL